MRRPPYQQVEDTLKAQILLGRRSVGYKLPIENTLSDMFNVSRDTVRRAIRSLKDEVLSKPLRESARWWCATDPKCISPP